MAYPEFMDYEFSIARGLTAHTSTIINAFAFQVSVTSRLVMPNNIFDATCPSSEFYLIASSSDANDATAGSGARSILINGIDANGAKQSETLPLSGQTGNTSANEYLRVNNITVNSAGSGGVNAGSIYLSESGSTLTAGVPGASSTVLNMVYVNYNTSHVARYYVPASCTAYLYDLSAAGGQTTVHAHQLRLYKKSDGGLAQVINRLQVGISGVHETYNIPIKFDAKTDVWAEVYGLASATVSHVSMKFMVYKDTE